MKLHVRLSNGIKFTTDFTASTVGELKEWLHTEHSCETPMRLIYKGRILDHDANSLAEHEVKEGCTLFVVPVKAKPPENILGGDGGKAETKPNAPSPSVATTASRSSSGPTQTSTATASASSIDTSAVPSFAGFDGQNPWMQQIQQRQNSLNAVFPNPASAAADASGVLNNPFFQSMLNNNPEFLTNIMRQRMESNPALRNLMESNPMVREVLQDPAALRDMLQAAANPELRAQQQRQQDLALSQLENMPGGFNALRNMYESVQAPLEESMMYDNNNGRSSAANNNATAGAAAGASGQAMPNPWGSPRPTAPRSTSGAASSSSARNPPGSNTNNSNTMASMIQQMTGTGAPSVDAMMEMMRNSTSAGSAAANSNTRNSFMQGMMMGNSGERPSQQQREAALNMLESNPALHQSIQEVILQNPAMLRQLLAQANPGSMAMVNSMDDQQLQNMLRMALNPSVMRNMMQMEEQLQQMGIDSGNTNINSMSAMFNPWAAEGTTGSPSTNALPPLLNPWGMPSNVGATSGNTGLDFTNLLMGQSGTNSTAAAANNRNQPPEVRYARQLQQMRDMGFDEEAVAIRALQTAHGNLNRAVDLLLSGSMEASGTGSNAASGTSDSISPSEQANKDSSQEKE